MAKRSALVVTTYNRPRLLADCLASVRGQTDQDWNLYILDDGSTHPDQQSVIADGISGLSSESVGYTPGHIKTDAQAIVWWGRDRSIEERRATISYSRSINIALNFLLRGEKYVMYLVDDDFWFPGAVGSRADYLDAHPDVHVVTGRQRSIQYDAFGFNSWGASTDPLPGMAFPYPTGRRELLHDGAAAKTYFENGETDPQTGLPFVEEAFWQEGPHWYGKPFRHDHNSVAHRRACLNHCGIEWYGDADAGGVQYWGESFIPHTVGDANFFEKLGAAHPFVGVNAWVASKRYHCKSTGVVEGDIRE